MGSDLIAEIERGRKVGYSDSLIRKSLELEGYSSESIRQGFREVEKKKNGKKNGNGFVVKTQSVKKSEASPPGKEKAPAKDKHWLKIVLEILISIAVFAIIGILIYLFLVPAVLS